MPTRDIEATGNGVRRLRWATRVAAIVGVTFIGRTTVSARAEPTNFKAGGPGKSGTGADVAAAV
jgi:hypothetical protein